MIEKALINNKAKLITQEHLSIIKNLDDKIETLLFLPEGEDRKGEGGLRTKGYFKHNYKMNKEDNLWYICDTNKNFIKPAPENIQKKIKAYVDYINNNSQFENKTLKNITELPLITVITVVLNGEKYLEQTIQSVINQTYPNLEYIIIDGGSSDGTLDIIKKYEDKIDYWVSEKDKGIYDAMNKGIVLTLGEWINFMNAGDTFYSEDILFEIFSFSKFEYYGVIYGNVGIKFENYLIYKKGLDINKIKYRIPFQHQSSFTKSTLLKKYKFNHNFQLAGDYDFFLKLKKTGIKFFYFNKTISSVLSDGMSDKNRIIVINEYYQIQKINNCLTIQNLIWYYFKLINENLKKIIKSVLPYWAIRIIRNNILNFGKYKKISD